MRGPLARLHGRRILLVSHDLSISGSPLLLVELARAMREAGAQVWLTSQSDDAATSAIPALRVERIVSTHESLATAQEVDLIVASTAVTGPWVRRLLGNVPTAASRLVWWIHELDTAAFGRHAGDLAAVAGALFDSEASLGAWRASGIALPRVVAVVNPGVRAALLAAADRATFAYRRGWRRQRSRAAIRRSLGVAPGDFLVSLFAWPEKGLDEFAVTVERLCANTPGLRLKALVIGFTHPRAAADFLRRHGGVRPRALDPARVLPITDDLTPYYAASDAFVVNTQGFGENFGRVTTEAMAFRLPVCGTRGGGTPEIVVDGRTGLLHPIGVAGQAVLTANLRRLAEDRDLARRLGEAGYRRVHERFTDRHMFAAFTDAVLASVPTARAVDTAGSGGHARRQGDLR